jgi:hypothetical protein|tara:strand:+ start:3555 stop:5870 length:2316 start_codon:yes stop_codon:yes gene_type:complete
MANTPVINSFNAGELSPYMYARNDLSKYNAGCLTLENFQILPYGGAVRRPAIKHVAETKSDDKVRLISFEFSSEQTYILELGDAYVRFYHNVAGVPTQIESAPSTPLEVVSPWAVADLYDIKYVQSADVMWFTHEDYPVYKLSRTSDTVWTLAEMVPDFPALLDENTTATTITPSATTGSVSLTATASSGIFDAAQIGSYWEIKHVRDDNAITVFDNSTGTFPAVNVPTSLTNAITGVGDYSFTTNGTYTNSYVAIWRTVDSGTTWERFRYYNMDGRNVDSTWEETDAGVHYAVTSSTGTIDGFRLFLNEFYTKGIVKITAVTDGENATATVIDTLGATDATTKWSEGAWSAYRGYPQACAIWESRTCFAGTTSNPNTLWFSQIDDFENFLTGTNDSDAMKTTIGSGRIDEIRWLVPQKALVIGTVGSEWVMEAESDNKPITPTSFALRRKTTYGSKKNQAILVNSAVLFVMRQGRKVREFTYRFDVDDYVAPDLTILSEHITTGGITTAAYQQQPDNVLLAIREDGTLIPMTYERDQEVTGWYRYTLDDGDGLFESVAVIPRDADEDQVWTSCQLTVNGSTKRYIGVFDNREWGTDVATEWNGSDFYTVFDNPATTTLTGLTYLEGMTVDVVRDGMVEPQKTVASGSITIDKVGTRVVVGVPYTSTIAPIYVEPPSQHTQPMGKKKGLFKAVIRFKDTLSANAGQSLSNLSPVIFRDSGDAMDSQVAMFSGEKKISFDSEYKFLHTCYIKQDKPLPITVVAMIPYVEVKG